MPMIFPTLEGMTAGEQEAHEAAMRRARGSAGPLSPNATKGPGKRQVGDAFRAQAAQLLERLQSGVEYSARDIFEQCTHKDYLFLKRMADAGMVIRSGAFGQFRYAKAAEVAPATMPEPEAVTLSARRESANAHQFFAPAAKS